MKKLYELKNQRQGLLDEASKAVQDKDMKTYDAKMAEVKALNGEIEALEALENENARFAMATPAPTLAQQGLTDRNDAAYMDAFFYAMVNGLNPKTGKGNEKLSPLYNALTETGGTPTGSDGGFLVPVEFNNMINEQRRQLVKLSDLFNVESVTSPTGWRAVDTAPTTGFDAVDEMGEIGSGAQPKFTKVSYSLGKYALRVPVSNELISDNTVGLMRYLARWFAKKGVITENSKLKALLNALTPSNLEVGKEIDDLKKQITLGLDPSIALGASIITNQSGFAYLDSLTGSDGRGLLQPDPTTGTPMLFKSKRVLMLSDSELPNREDEEVGTAGIYYPLYIGDFRTFGTLFKKNVLEVASTNIGGNAWITDSTEVRGIMRLDAQTLDSAAVIKREIFIADEEA